MNVEIFDIYGKQHQISNLKSQFSIFKSQISNLNFQISNLKSQISIKSQTPNFTPQIRFLSLLLTFINSFKD